MDAVGQCRKCYEVFGIRKDGMLRAHGPTAARCPGSGQWPTGHLPPPKSLTRLLPFLGGW